MLAGPFLTTVPADVRVRDELLARVAHEARTPIGAILTWLELLKAHGPGSPQGTRAIEMAERSARELTEIIAGAEDAQRVMAGTLELQKGPLDLGRVLRSAVDRVLPGAQARSIALDCETARHARRAHGDDARLRHAFTRLLAHGVGLSGPGRVQVRAEDQGEDVRVDLLFSALTLTDTLREALQDEGGWPSLAGPCGQALLDFALARRMVALHQGRLESESLNGQGTRISALLPLAAASA